MSEPKGTQRVSHPTLSIRMVLMSLGALSILVSIGLAGFAWLGTQNQLHARLRIVMLEQTLHNHNTADAFMDDIRADVMRAVLSSLGTNKEDDTVIRDQLRHHVEVVTTGISENLGAPLATELHQNYIKIADMIAVFVASGQSAVELALGDATAGADNFEHFRHEFSVLEDLMDNVRDVLHAEVAQVRADATTAAVMSKRMIVGSCVVGVILLGLVTMVAVHIAQRITMELASSREEAHHIAVHDILTGLPNRGFLAVRLEQVLTEGQRNETMLAMLCLDLDRFKQVNDTLGHPVGDALLCAVADRLRKSVRKSDTVVRLGGDEFAIIQAPLPHIKDAARLAERVVEALSEPYDLNGHQVLIGASVGIALFPTDTRDAANLLKMADLALYRAKNEGRGMFRMFEPGMDTKLQARRILELDLRRAVTMQEFELHYQPVVDLASGRVTAMEALVRWHHPQRGLIRPDEFIPLAEETGLIQSIGAWVLQQACTDAVHWPSDLRIAVNVSPAQFKGSALVAAVANALMVTALPPERLELEITETALITDAAATLAILHELRAKGIRIAMDDFGTGYSSLSYLRSFPFDKIKIDRCFIQDIATNPDCRAIVRAVTALSSDLGITTTAEGVETAAQLDQLRAEGCDQIQGYLFSRPVPAQDVAGILRRNLLEIQKEDAERLMAT